MTMYDFRPTSLHKTIGRITNAQYLDSKPLECLPLPMLHGVHIQRFLHDTTHSQLLGTSKTLNGSCLTYLCEAGEFSAFEAGVYEQSLAKVLRVAFHDFKQWLRSNHLLATQPRFTTSRLNRKHRGMFPVLASKAINGKRISFWLASKCYERLERLGESATKLDKLVHTCVWSYCSMLRRFDEYGMVMSVAQASELHQVGMVHLLTYSRLRGLSAETRGKVLNRTLWSVLPKHHHLQHALDEARSSLVNPGCYHLLAAESWVGNIGRMSRYLDSVYKCAPFNPFWFCTPYVNNYLIVFCCCFFLYICMCKYVHVYTYISTYIYICVYIHTYLHVYIHICIHTCIHLKLPKPSVFLGMI